MYHIDAFTAHVFQGNPAAVCPLSDWLPDTVMQQVAAENNLSETAFFVPTEQGFAIRWFTPTVEVNLCGHATLAAAYVLFEEQGYEQEEIIFFSKSGVLQVQRQEGMFVLDFPAQFVTPCMTPKIIAQAFGHRIEACLKGEDYLVVLKHEDDVLHAKPDIQCLELLDLRGVMITAKSSSYDFVSRFFAPKLGIAEDPVTGSSFTQLIPYWSGELGKSKLLAKQVSKRGGEVAGELCGPRVKIAGQAVKYLEGTVYITAGSNV